jgi:fructose-specific phosphotransferase system IIC component
VRRISSIVGPILSANSDGSGSVDAMTYGVSAGMYCNKLGDSLDLVHELESIKNMTLVAAIAGLAILFIDDYLKKYQTQSSADCGLERHR